jgi:hypothetical protein
MMVAVMALRSHILSAVHFADYATGEITLSDGFWNELPDNSLTIADRNFLVADDQPNQLRQCARLLPQCLAGLVDATPCARAHS